MESAFTTAPKQGARHGTRVNCWQLRGITLPALGWRRRRAQVGTKVGGGVARLLPPQLPRGSPRRRVQRVLLVLLPCRIIGYLVRLSTRWLTVRWGRISRRRYQSCSGSRMGLLSQREERVGRASMVTNTITTTTTIATATSPSTMRL